MKKLKAEEHAKLLMKANGLSIALRIADRCVKGSSKEMEAQIPHGPIFFPTDKKGGNELAVKARDKSHNFWLQVKAILNKELNKEKR